MTATETTTKMTDAEYFAAQGLSNSGLKDLAVSPLRYWYRHINPERPADEPTFEMQIGSALHCAVLEPSEFDKRYAVEITAESIEGGCLVTIEDIRGWIRSMGVDPKGTKKADVIAQALALNPEVPIFEVIERKHSELHAGKVMFKPADMKRVHGMARALFNEPEIANILADKEGRAEVPMFANDPDTGVPLRAKMDWVTPTVTLDLKTFSQQRSKSIDKSVTDAVLYERYYWQAWFYSFIRSLQPGSAAKQGKSGAQTAQPFILAFVESEEPYEIRIRSLRPKVGGEVNLYWEIARTEVQSLIRTYKAFETRYGVQPWRDPREIDDLIDVEMKALAFR